MRQRYSRGTVESLPSAHMKGEVKGQGGFLEEVAS